MSTNIRVDVDSDGLRKRLREQQKAQRLAYLEKGRQKSVEQDALDAKAARDQQLIRQFPSPLTKETLKRRGYRPDELAAFRKGCPTTIKLGSSEEYQEYQWATVSFTGTVNTDASLGVLIRPGLLRHTWSQVNFVGNNPDPEEPPIYEWQEEDTLQEWWHLSWVSPSNQYGARNSVLFGFGMVYPDDADDVLFNSGDYIDPLFNFGYLFFADRSLVRFRGYQRWLNYTALGEFIGTEPFPRPLSNNWGTLSGTDKIGPYEVGVEMSSDGGANWASLVWAFATSTGAGTPSEIRAVTSYTPFVIDMKPVNESAPSVAANCVYKR